jgi:MFS family permease
VFDAAPQVRPPMWTRAFVTVVTAQMTFGYASSTFLLLPKYLSTELHASASQIGHVMAATNLAAVIAIPFVGTAIDRFGRKPLVLLGCGLTMLYALGWLFVTKLDAFMLGLQVLGGISFMIAFNAAGTIVADQAPAERLGEAIGIFGAANMAMSAIAPATAELLAVSVGWHAAFGLAAAVALVSLVLAQRIHEQRVPAASTAASAASGLGFAAMLPLLRRQLPQSIAMTMCGAGFGAVMTFYQPFVIAQGAQHVSGFFVGFTVAAVATRLLFGSLPDRVGRRRAAIGSDVCFAAMVLAMIALTPGRLLLFGFLFGCTHGIFYPSLSASCVEQSAIAERGRVMTLVMGAFRLGNVASALVLGSIAELYGFRTVFVVAAAGCMIGVAALYWTPADGRAA